MSQSSHDNREDFFGISGGGFENPLFSFIANYLLGKENAFVLLQSSKEVIDFYNFVIMAISITPQMMYI
jgi:hypothetical protein